MAAASSLSYYYIWLRSCIVTHSFFERFNCSGVGFNEYILSQPRNTSNNLHNFSSMNALLTLTSFSEMDFTKPGAVTPDTHLLLRRNPLSLDSKKTNTHKNYINTNCAIKKIRQSMMSLANMLPRMSLIPREPPRVVIWSHHWANEPCKHKHAPNLLIRPPIHPSTPELVLQTSIAHGACVRLFVWPSIHISQCCCKVVICGCCCLDEVVRIQLMG